MAQQLHPARTIALVSVPARKLRGSRVRSQRSREPAIGIEPVSRWCREPRGICEVTAGAHPVTVEEPVHPRLALRHSRRVNGADAAGLLQKTKAVGRKHAIPG